MRLWHIVVFSYLRIFPTYGHFLVPRCPRCTYNKWLVGRVGQSKVGQGRLAGKAGLAGQYRVGQASSLSSCLGTHSIIHLKLTHFEVIPEKNLFS